MKPFQVMALTPPGLDDPSIAIAASRAGGVGILDLEYATSEASALAAIEKLSRHSRGVFGIKFDGNAEGLVNMVVPLLPEQAEWVIVTYADLKRLKRQVRNLRKRNIRILLEASSLDQASAGAELGIDGLIAKGNEAGGWVGQEMTFILLQRILAAFSFPVWAQGGIGLHTAAACCAAGAAGVVMADQLLLTRESPLPKLVREVIARSDGSETICLGEDIGAGYRIFGQQTGGAHSLRRFLDHIIQEPRPRKKILDEWMREVRLRVRWDDSDQHIWPLGQEVAFAASMARRFVTVAGVLEGVRQAVASHIRVAREKKPLAESSPLARSHNTRYPIVQGPMSRVSDVPLFALKVAEGGGLPFLAIGVMGPEELKLLLEETCSLLARRPFGVGILGFIQEDLYRQQINMILTHRPSFAIIAGGRPDQARSLEKEGIYTYLHVPSPGLLKMFFEDGARRFIFEGRECGGHVGPRSSFILWNQMIDLIFEYVPKEEMGKCHVLFAGGVHDSVSSSMIATMAAPLVELGLKVGVLLGTAYLFTQEAVSTGAITKTYQEEAIRCLQTATLESGPGHAVRCSVTPYVNVFGEEKRRLFEEQQSQEQIRLELEHLNLGRLRCASKGQKRNPDFDQDPHSQRFISLNAEEQRCEGLYMIGQVAALHQEVFTIDRLHHDVSRGGSERLEKLEEPPPASVFIVHEQHPSDIAVIGMACLFPKASTLRTYWENILNKVDAITEVPEDRWESRLLYDPDPRARDKSYSKWGGFLDAIPFDPTNYGMPPNSLPSIEPLQLLTLETARAALQDAGYETRPFPRDRTSVIIGAGGGVADLGTLYNFRSMLPLYFRNVPKKLSSQLPEWTEDSFAGILNNVAAGRVSNRFDLGGANYTIDAACASSLAAVYTAVRELESGASDMVVVGGADTAQSPFAYLCFSKTMALSPKGRCRTFDQAADGTSISEGIAVLILKRLADAERDGDRIYATIKAVGASSDGRAKGLTAPHPEGQASAMKRAYAKAGFPPSTVGLIESHGTGTVAGDRAEIETLKSVFGNNNRSTGNCALGSVKSMIGHTKCAAGLAGLIKVALALHYKVLPPTIGIEEPSPSLSGSPFYVNTEPRPWIQGSKDHPRRAGASAFGFGGTNFHCVLEEYRGGFARNNEEMALEAWPSELFIWRGRTRSEIQTSLEALREALVKGGNPSLSDLSFTLWNRVRGEQGLTLALVATSIEDLRGKISAALDGLNRSGPASIQDPRGIYFAEEPLGRPQSIPIKSQQKQSRNGKSQGPYNGDGKIAFLFSGQGSQYPDMVKDLTLYFPEVRDSLELAEAALTESFKRPLSSYIFPPPCFSQAEKAACEEALRQANIAQPALGAVEMGLFRLLTKFGIIPDMLAGHSYGEYPALCAAGVFSEDSLYLISETRGRLTLDGSAGALGKMAAVEASRKAVAEVIRCMEDVWIANLNSPKQTIISGTVGGVEGAMKALKARGITTKFIAVSCAYHSPMMAAIQEHFGKFLAGVDFRVPEIEVFSNLSGTPYPREAPAIGPLLVEHLARPVEFMKEIESIYDRGGRIFIEVGPRNVLTTLTTQILGDRPCLAVATDAPGRSGLTQLQHALGQLLANGVPCSLDRLYERGTLERLNLKTLEKKSRTDPLRNPIWMVNGGRSWPLKKPPNKTPPMRFSIQETASTYEGEPGPAYEMRQKEPNDTERHSDMQTRPPSSTQPPIQLETPQTGSVPRTLGSPVDSVIIEHQQLMNRFLEVQQHVMMAYLSGEPSREMPLSEPMGHSERLQGKTEPLKALPADPAASPEPPATPAPNEAESLVANGLDQEQVTEHLLGIISERTGYPPEMLNLDLDLEADLGIDSIKRVEILGAMLQTIKPQAQEIPPDMEELARIKTMRGIIEWIAHAVSVGGGPLSARAAEPERTLKKGVKEDEESAKDLDKRQLSRFLLTMKESPLSGQSLQVTRGAVILITDDEQGIASNTADKLLGLGAKPLLVRMNTQAGRPDEETYSIDLSDPKAVEGLLEEIHQKHGPVSGLIHLLPLRSRSTVEELTLSEWRTNHREEIKSLFYLAKAVREDLLEAARAGTGFLLAATAMGGAFGIGEKNLHPFFPGNGGVAGVVKTLAVEWDSVNCKVVDLDLSLPGSTITEKLLAEMVDRNVDVEVGYRDSHRMIPHLALSPLAKGNRAGISIDSEWVVAVTGGARGITAEIALDLAERYGPTLLLVGRTPLPETDESATTLGKVAPAELKAALMEEMRATGEQITVAQVESRYRRLLKEREIRGNITAMERAGARVRYFSADVCDAQSFGELIEEIYRSYGRLDGFIHGAGIIEDKLVESKSPGSFDRVFDTKVDSAFLLAKKLSPESLRFLVFFSSVAGRFGNRGQIDYVAANEVLNKLAVYLDRQWPGRVVAINWGPWDKAGMVTDEVREQFAKRGVEVIEPAAGRFMFDRELAFGSKGDVEVTLGDMKEKDHRTGSSGDERVSLPLFHGCSFEVEGANLLEVIRTLDLEKDLFLRDHQLDGIPVFPMAMAVEMMAELAQRALPEKEVLSIHSLQVLKGIVLDETSVTLRISARPKMGASLEKDFIEVETEIAAMQRREPPFYRAIIRLGKRSSESPPYGHGVLSELHAFPLTVPESYERLLFQGPFFQGISSIDGICDSGISGLLIPSSPALALSGVKNGGWLVDPVLLDSSLQLAILWARTYYDMTPLPARFSCYHCFDSPPTSPVQCYVHTKAYVKGHVMTADIYYIDTAGRVIGFLEQMESSCTKELNRLTVAPKSRQGGR
jgi:acyl transferase domain-containing protein/NAD(P)H-dependent flavin oxidoreductase YrpB (nitropropane dioxygenase family)/NAD(P)-dependent dehydrogenase (short-subunit alcohol dehydrogenase family)